MKTYTEADGPFNIVVVYSEPCMGKLCLKPKVVSNDNDLARAERMVAGIKRQIATEESKGWTEGVERAVDAYMEPAAAPVPYGSVELALLYTQQDRDHSLAMERGEQLHAALCVTMGRRRADEVREGVFVG